MQHLTYDKQKAAQSEDTIFMTFDLKPLLPLPRISTSVAFYLRKLWFHNFGIHIVCNMVAAGHGYMFSWLESEGRKRLNEIASGLIVFDDLVPIGKDKLIAWSDSNYGQGKNQLLLHYGCISLRLVDFFK